MTRQELLAIVFSETAYDNPPPTVVARIGRFLQEGVRQVLSEPGLERLQDSDTPYTFSTVAAQARYVVPESIARLLHFTERTNDWRLTPMSLAEYRALDPDPTVTSGTPTHFVPIGQVGVAVQPSNASEIFVDSDSGSDVNTAYLEGIITGGYTRRVAVTMTGTTAVSFSSAITSFIELNDFYLSHPAVGTVTLHEDASGGTELARITIGKTRPTYYGFYLWPTPAAAVTYYVDYRRALAPFISDSAEPPGPAEFHDLYADYAIHREWLFKKDFDAAAVAKSRFDGRLSKLKYATQVDSDQIVIAGRGRRIGHSRLGAYYPADSWR